MPGVAIVGAGPAGLVVAYLLQQNGMPAGNTAMAPGLLTTIRIDPNKPGT